MRHNRFEQLKKQSMHDFMRKKREQIIRDRKHADEAQKGMDESYEIDMNQIQGANSMPSTTQNMSSVQSKEIQLKHKVEKHRKLMEDQI